jgi:hypothetical protein
LLAELIRVLLLLEAHSSVNLAFAQSGRVVKVAEFELQFLDLLLHQRLLSQCFLLVLAILVAQAKII